MASPTYRQIASTTLGSSQSTITVSSIPQTFRDLIIVCSLKAATTDANTYYITSNLKFNSNSNAVYNQIYHYSFGGNPGPLTGSNAATTSISFSIPGDAGTPYGANANDYGITVIDVLNYSSTTLPKTYAIDGEAVQEALKYYKGTGFYSATGSGISTLTFTCSSGNFKSGSSVMVYGI